MLTKCENFKVKSITWWLRLPSLYLVALVYQYFILSYFHTFILSYFHALILSYFHTLIPSSIWWHWYVIFHTWKTMIKSFLILEVLKHYSLNLRLDAMKLTSIHGFIILLWTFNIKSCFKVKTCNRYTWQQGSSSTFLSPIYLSISRIASKLRSALKLWWC